MSALFSPSLISLVVSVDVQHHVYLLCRRCFRTTSGWYGYWPKIQGQSLVNERQRWCLPRRAQNSIIRVLGWPDVYD